MRSSSSSCWTKRITCVYSFSLVSLFVVAVFVLTFDDSNNSSIGRTLITSPYIAMKMKLDELSTAENIFRYLHWTNSTSCLFAVDFGFGIWNGRGVAAPDGHKAVCLDRFIAPVYGQCLVYSFGINKQWSFDEAMDTFGCQVYSFDPSMPGVENHNRTKNIHFYNIGLSGMDGINSSGWNMKTASSIYKMLAKSHHHGSSTLIDVFKMDIEYSEWDAIPQMLRTGFLAEKVKQLAVEIHFNASDTLDNFQRRVGILQDLENNGNFIRFSSRPNPWLLRSISILGDKQEYIGLELAWYNSRYYNGP